MTPLPAACLPILAYLRRQRRYVSVRELFTMCPTNSPTRRITDLDRAKLIDKRKNPSDRRYTEYRIRRTA